MESQDIFDKHNSTCLKGVAIIMLLIHHSFMEEERYAGADITFIIPENIWNYVALFFKICVCVFAFISTYGLSKKMMTMSSSGKSRASFLKEYLSARLIRLLGAFIFVFLLVDLFALFYDPGRFANIYGTAFPENFVFFFIDMFGLAEFLGTPTFLTTYWFYSLAILIIFLVPVFYLMLEGIGSPYIFLGLVAIINFTVEIPNTDFWRYIFCIAVGVVCAKENVITKIVTAGNIRGGRSKCRKFAKLLAELVLLFVLMVLRESGLKNILYPVFDAVIPIMLCAFCCEFIFIIPGVKQALFFLGKYSANIFMVHNFILRIWFFDFSYSFHHPLLIVLVLLLISLVLSVMIELLKKVLRYDRFLDLLIDKVNKKERRISVSNE